MPPGAPVGRCAKPARTGLRGARGTPMPGPVLRAQGSARHPQMGLQAPAPGRLGRRTCSRSPTESSSVRRCSTQGPAAGAAPGSWEATGMPPQLHTQPESLSPGNTWARPSQVCPAAHLYQEAGGTEPSHPAAPGRRVQGSLKTSEAGSQACAPQGSLGAAGCSARRSPLGGPQVMAWAQGAGKAQGTPCPQPKDGGPHKHAL